jgi:hypothetical protein
MKIHILLLLLAVTCLTGCDMAGKINRSTYEINRNTCVIDQSTAAINRNLVQLEAMQQSQ